MDVVSLTTFLKQNHILTAVVFPLEAARYVPASAVIGYLKLTLKGEIQTKTQTELLTSFLSI
jgi:hypothetical protein